MLITLKLYSLHRIRIREKIPLHMFRTRTKGKVTQESTYDIYGNVLTVMIHGESRRRRR